MKSPKTTNFNSIGSSILNAGQAAPVAPDQKAKPTSFELQAELRQPLDRVVFWNNKPNTSMKSVLNDALKFYFENHPQAQKWAAKPTPREDAENGME
jgi:hypothetical protein